MDEDSKTKKRSLSPLAILIVVLIAIAGWLFFFLPGPHPPGYHLQCAWNLRKIGTAIFIYANDNDDHFPPDLYTLVEQGSIPNDAKLFHCPCIRKEQPLSMRSFSNRSAFRTDYWYYPGNSEGTNAAETGIVTDKLGNHETHFTGGGTILFADGHTKLFTGKEWYRNSGQSEPPPGNSRL